MKKILLGGLLLMWLHSGAQVYPMGGISLGLNTGTMVQIGAEAGVTAGRVLAAAEYKYGEYNAMSSVGVKAGVCAWLDRRQNEGLYLIVGASKDTWTFDKERVSQVRPMAVVRWQFYNAFFDVGMQNGGWAATVGWDFKHINW